VCRDGSDQLSLSAQPGRAVHECSLQHVLGTAFDNARSESHADLLHDFAMSGVHMVDATRCTGASWDAEAAA
jgi:hypothetical protein